MDESSADIRTFGLISLFFYLCCCARAKRLQGLKAGILMLRKLDARHESGVSNQSACGPRANQSAAKCLVGGETVPAGLFFH